MSRPTATNKRLERLERLVAIFLEAEHKGEMGDRDKAVEALEKYMSHV